LQKYLQNELQVIAASFHITNFKFEHFMPYLYSHLQVYQVYHRAALATSGSTTFRRMPTPYRYLRCGDLRSPGVMERHKSPPGLCDDDDEEKVKSTMIHKRI